MEASSLPFLGEPFHLLPSQGNWAPYPSSVQAWGRGEAGSLQASLAGLSFFFL